MADYFHGGALSNMAQIDAMIMMTVGGGIGIILLIIGVVGSVKTRQSGHLPVDPGSGVAAGEGAGAPVRGGAASAGAAPSGGSSGGGAIRKLSPAEREQLIKTLDTRGGLLYGPEAWAIWDVEVLDAVPAIPQVDLSKKDKVLLYIPHRIRVNGKEQVLKEILHIGGPGFKY